MSISVIQSTDTSKTSTENVLYHEFGYTSTNYQINDGTVNITSICPNPPCSGGW